MDIVIQEVTENTPVPSREEFNRLMEIYESIRMADLLEDRREYDVDDLMLAYDIDRGGALILNQWILEQEGTK